MDSNTINLNVEPSVQQESLGGEVIEVIRRIYNENKKTTQMVADIFEKYSTLHSQLMRHFKIDSPPENEIDTNYLDPRILKRKVNHLGIIQKEDDDNNMISSCVIDGNCCKRIKMINLKPKVSRVLVRVDSSDSSLVVKDGYQWRKYGQKGTRDNPSPRAYFKCSFAPLCPVKKKVQRSVEDPKVLVVTYKGEHTHKKPSSHGSSLEYSPKIPSPPSSLINLSPSSSYVSSPDLLVHQILNNNNHKYKGSENIHDQESHTVQHCWLVEQMASSLTKDHSFTSTIATTISDKVVERTFC